MISVLPSPLKSPVWTSTQVTLGFQVVTRWLVKAEEPLDAATHHCPLVATRPKRPAKEVFTWVVAWPVIELVIVSVAVTVWLPADTRVTPVVKVWKPALATTNTKLAGKGALPSELVK